MYRFRIPEIVLGFGLGIVAFLFVAGVTSYHTDHCGLQTLASSEAQPAGSDDRNPKVNRDRQNDPIACNVTGFPGALVEYMDANEGFFVGLFTFCLVVATVLLWWATNALWRAGERQIKVMGDAAHDQINAMRESNEAAKDAAHAALLNARAAVQVEMPIISIVKVQLHREAGVEGAVVGLPPAKTTLIIDFKNRGRTAAELRALSVQWEVAKTLSTIPLYKFTSKYPFAPGVYLEQNKTLPTGVARFPILLEPNEIISIREEGKSLWAFGYLSFSDFMGNPHETRFCVRWQPYAPQPDGTIKPLGFVYDSETPAAYTRNT